MVSLSQFQKDGERLGVVVAVTRDGRIDLEGSVGNLKKMWALQGFDVIKAAGVAVEVWNCYKNGTYFGSVMRNTETGFAFSTTTKI